MRAPAFALWNISSYMRGLRRDWVFTRETWSRHDTFKPDLWGDLLEKDNAVGRIFTAVSLSSTVPLVSPQDHGQQ